MEATYVGIHMWKQAVEKAKSTDTDKVIAAMGGQTFKAPGGFTSTMDPNNRHLHKPVIIGKIKADGQFDVMWKTPGPVKPSREARTSTATTRRRTSPRRSDVLEAGSAPLRRHPERRRDLAGVLVVLFGFACWLGSPLAPPGGALRCLPADAGTR